MAFKTISIPIMEMEGAEEDWKKRFYVANSDIGCLIAPTRSGTTVQLRALRPDSRVRLRCLGKPSCEPVGSLALIDGCGDLIPTVLL